MHIYHKLYMSIHIYCFTEEELQYNGEFVIEETYQSDLGVDSSEIYTSLTTLIRSDVSLSKQFCIILKTPNITL